MNPSKPSPVMTIGELARRAGMATSTLRYYESAGLMNAARSAGRHRLYPRDALRRVAFIRVAQSVGLSLEDIRQALSSLPSGRTPDKADWTRLASRWRAPLDERIAALTRLRDQLGSCIGCGCLSLKACALYNPADQAAGAGPGPRYLLGDRPPAAAAKGATAPPAAKPLLHSNASGESPAGPHDGNGPPKAQSPAKAGVRTLRQKD